MAGQANTDLFQQAVDLFAQRVADYADGIAQRLGTPMSGQQLTRDQVLQRWSYTPLGDQATADAAYHQMVAQGMPPGQALDQTYPFRKMLFAGPDLKSQIATAQQIAGWHADASGTEPPQPNPQQSPILQPAQPAPAPPMPALGPGMPPNPPGALPAAGGIGGGMPVPVQSPPVPPVPMPAAQGMPMAGLGQPMPEIQPVPGLS